MPYYIILVKDNINKDTKWFEYDDADELINQIDYFKANYILEYVFINGEISFIDTWNKLYKKIYG